jgi:thiol-disulfide isomerase/thioredoxin
MEKMKQSTAERKPLTFISFISLVAAVLTVLLLSQCTFSTTSHGSGSPLKLDAFLVELAEQPAGSYTAQLTTHYFATDERDTSEAYVQWVPAVGDSGWAAIGYYRVADSLRTLSQHVLDTVSTSVRDSSFERSTVGSERISGYWPGKLCPPFLGDTAWFGSAFDGDADIVWYHTATRSDTTWTFDITAHADTSDPDASPEDILRYHIDYDATSARLIHFDFEFFESAIAYGYLLDVTFDWTDESADEVADEVLNWAPDSVFSETFPEPEVERTEAEQEAYWEEQKVKYTAGLPVVGEVAPELAGIDLQGDSTRLTDYRGELVFLDFWYIGCGPCMQALPHLQEAGEKYADRGFRVVGSNAHQSPEVLTSYFEKRGLDLAQIITDGRPEDYNIRVHPTWYLIGRDGAVLETGLGYGEGSDAELDSLIQVHL